MARRSSKESKDDTMGGPSAQLMPRLSRLIVLAFLVITSCLLVAARHGLGASATVATAQTSAPPMPVAISARSISPKRPELAPELALVFEAAIDEDGDIRLWRHSTRLQLFDAAMLPVLSGCGGKLTSLDMSGQLRGRLSCAAAQQPPGGKERSLATQVLRPGMLAWVNGASDPEFVIHTGKDSSEGSGRAFAQIDADSLARLSVVHTMPTTARGTAKIFDSPIEMRVAGGRRGTL